jgi:hypothetical protein
MGQNEGFYIQNTQPGISRQKGLFQRLRRQRRQQCSLAQCCSQAIHRRIASSRLQSCDIQSDRLALKKWSCYRGADCQPLQIRLVFQASQFDRREESTLSIFGTSQLCSPYHTAGVRIKRIRLVNYISRWIFRVYRIFAVARQIYVALLPFHLDLSLRCTIVAASRPFKQAIYASP